MGEGYKIFQPRFFLSQKRQSIRADTIGEDKQEKE